MKLRKISIKEVILFTYGNSNDISTWSNIPYLFARSLEDNGIKVNRVDLSKDFYNKSLDWGIKVILKFITLTSKLLLGKKTAYTTHRTIFYRFIADKKIKKSVELYRKSNLCIFLTFDFRNRWSNIPTLVFSDWTFDILINDRLNRKPNFLEKKFIAYEYNILKRIEYIVPMFPLTYKSLLDKGYENLLYLEANVINSVCCLDVNSDELIKKKEKSNKILFIGRKNYLEGAILLINTVIRFKGKYELNIIGLSDADFDVILPPYIKTHGFLRKDIKEECDLYYKLIFESKLFTNPTPNWGGYSSTVECMYYYTPAIVFPYTDFVEEFGRNIGFGFYNDVFDTDTLQSNITKIMESNSYTEMSLTAHKVVEKYTWDNYIQKLLSKI